MVFFAYWSGPGGDEATADWRADWSRYDPDLRIYTDADVRPLAVALLGEPFGDLWDRITLPTCKSDLARLILLWKFGGVYLDVHVGTVNPQNVSAVRALAEKWDLVVFDLVDRAIQENRPQHLFSSVLAGRAGAPVFSDILSQIAAALGEHEAKEAASAGLVPYNLFPLVGMGAVGRAVLQAKGSRHVVRSRYFGRVLLRRIGGHGRYEEMLFHLYRHYGYRQPGAHWSERQAHEPLFLPRR